MKNILRNIRFKKLIQKDKCLSVSNLRVRDTVLSVQFCCLSVDLWQSLINECLEHIDPDIQVTRTSEELNLFSYCEVPNLKQELNFRWV